MLTIITSSPEETIDLGAKIARNIEKSAFIALEGSFGSGKTVFVKGIAKGLGIKDYFYVNSPSFVILKEYKAKVSLYHFDMYRVDAKHFADTLDYKKYFYSEAVNVVEWAEVITDILPDEYLEVRIEHDGEFKRKFNFLSHGDSHRRFLLNL